MPFFVDDIFLRILGVSIPPFDMIWLMETIRDYVEEVGQEEINKKIKENRLLYELGEMTKEEYEKRHKELNRQLRTTKRIERTNLKQRISLLG